MDKIAKRKPNWSNEEIEVLVQGVTDNIRLIKGKFTPSITNEAKNRCWVEITSQVNAVNCSNFEREVCDVKKKWQDLSSQIKKREAEKRRGLHATGGGPGVLIVGTISKSSLEGVSGGVDTSAPSQSLIMEKELSYVFEASPASTTQMKPSIPESACSEDVQQEEQFETGDESHNLRREFLDGEGEKNKTAEDYRKKKISLLEKIVQQQSELIEIQRRTTTALEVIATKFHESTQSLSPYSLSPVIKFS
uniref:Myb/SANT-like DNA-binding domain-containing protein n=1 Tax=Magallana gigas TaxID=29159 RepID=A0A8W8LPF5_MAGGI